MSAFTRRFFSVTVSCVVAVLSCEPYAAAAAASSWENPTTVARMTPADAAVSRTGESAVALSSGNKVYVARRPAGAGWGTSELVGSAGGGGWAQVAYDRAGHVVVAWSDTTAAGTTVYSRRTLEDGAWGATEQVATRGIGQASYLQLAVSDSGAAVLGWVYTTPTRGRLLVNSRTAGGVWSSATRLGPAGQAHVALGNAGDAAVAVSTVQSKGDQSTEVLTLFRRSPGGVWGAGEEIARLPGITFAVGLPDVAVDKYGITTVVWRDQAEDGRWQVLAGRARRAADLRIVKRVAKHTGFAYESGPQLVSNPAGEVMLVTWTRGNGALAGRRWLSGGPHRNWGQVATLAPQNHDVLFWSTAMERNGRGVAVWTRGGWFGNDGLGVQARRMNKYGGWGPLTQVAPTRAHVLKPLAGEGANDSLAVWWQRRPSDRWVTRASAFLVE
jgi:hypothetical protein